MTRSQKACFTGLLTALTAIALTACHKTQKKTDGDSDIMPVEVAVPVVDSVVLTNIYPGNLVAQQQVDIMARVDGVVKGVHAASGQKVRRGQLLYSIEDTKYRDAVRQAEASLSTARSDYEYYRRQYAAMQKAYQSDAVSEMEVLQAKNNMEQSLASIENASAALQSAQLMLSYCNVTAPFDGTLALATFDRDAYVNGEAEPVKLNTLYNDDVLHAYISIDEPAYLRLMNNRERQHINLDSVEITFAAPMTHRYFSTIDYAAPEVNTSTGTVTMRFNVDNTRHELKSGMYMTLHLPYEAVSDAMLIRDAAIGTDQLGKYVYTVNDSGKVVYTHIETGDLYNDTMRIVKSGLTPDSRYITQALLKVRNGMKVQPVEK